MKKLFGVLLVVALVLSFSLMTTTPVAAQVEHIVNWDGSGDFLTIQEAIDAADPAGGDTIIVAAGEYQEQLLIDKGLTLRPATVNGDFVAVTIKAPDYSDRTRIVKAGWPQDCYDYIIRVIASDVTIEGFTIEGHDGMYRVVPPGQHRHCDGVWRGSAEGDVSRDPRRVGFFGIWYDGEDEGGITGGQVRNNTITDVVAWVASAIMVSDAAEVAVEENVMPIHVWGNVGIIAEGTGTVVTAYWNEMSGTVGDSAWSQGGIQFSGGATGSAVHNTVEDLRSGTGAMSTGIAVYEGAEVALIENNTLNNTDCAILVWGPGEDTRVSLIRDNTLSNSRYYGIAVYEGSEVHLIWGNAVEANAWGILTYPWGGRAAQIDAIQCNTISDNTSGGIIFLADTVLPVVHYNNIVGNTLGIRNDCVQPVDATLNWWGDASGPYHDADNPGGTGDAVTDNVDFDPWLTALLEESLSVQTATDTGPAVFALSDGNIESLEAIPAISPAPRGVSFPHGMFDFVICCIDAGETVLVTVTLPAAVPVGTVWWKYHDGGWYSLPNQNDNGDNIMVIALIDGGLGDADETADGFIRDPGGPGNPMAPLAVGWAGSPVNRAAVMAPWIGLFAAVIAGATLVVVRRRRAQT